MAINRTRHPKGKMEGGWHIEKVHYTGEKDYYNCAYYHKEKGICMNAKSHKYFFPCNFACRRWADTPKRSGKTKSTSQKSNSTQEYKLNPTKQDHTLCRYYEAETGRCHNIKCELDFPLCEGACIYWERRMRDKNTKNSLKKQGPITPTKKKEFAKPIDKKLNEECKFYTEGTGKCSHPFNTRFVGTCYHRCEFFIKEYKK